MQALTFLSLKNAGHNRVTLADSGDNAGHAAPEPGLRTVPSGVFHAVLGGRWVGVLSDASVCPLALGPLSHMRALSYVNHPL